MKKSAPALVKRAPQKTLPGAVLAKAVFRAARSLGLSRAELSGVIGVSPSSVSRMGVGGYTLGGKPFELAACLVRVARSLDAVAHGDGDSVKAWMAGRNAHLNAVPKEEIKTAPGLVRVMTYLDAARAPV